MVADITIRRIMDINPHHINYIAMNMREADRKEVWASSHMTPEEALWASIKSSPLSHTVFIDSEPRAMFGIGAVSALSKTGIPWLLGTKGIEKYLTSFGRYSRLFISFALENYEELENYIYIRNKKSIKWLRWLGFQFDDPAPFGPDKLMFQRFHMRRKDNV